MKRGLVIIIFLLFFTSAFGMKTFAANREDQEKDIIIDGDFNDWEGKPYVEDPKHDIETTWMDFLGAKYFADDKYLYLNVDRLSANKSESWNFSVVILNGTRGDKHFQNLLPPYKPVDAPQFDVKSYYTDNKSHSGTVVEVNFDGERIESTFSADNNDKDIEFRIPLEKVGLNGVNREVEFILKSDIAEGDEIDWMPDGSPIIITTGPTFWQFSTIVFSIVISFAAYRVYRSKDKNVS